MIHPTPATTLPEIITILAGETRWYFVHEVARHSFILEKDATLYCVVLAHISDERAWDLSLSLEGAGSRAYIFGAVIMEEGARLDAQCSVQHSAPDTESHVSLRSALFADAVLTCRGIIGSKKGARGGKGAFHHKSIILGESAQVKTIPSLEICSDEMSAHHSATIDLLSPEQLWYAQSRGISLSDVHRLYYSGFLAHDAQGIPHPEIAENMRSYFSLQ